MKEKMTKTPVVVFLAMICCLLWGSAFACIKIGYKLFNIESKDTMSQILFAGNRFILAGIMVIVTFSIMNKKIIKPAQPERIATLSLFQTVLQYVPFYVGLAHTTGVKSSIINGLGVFFTVLVSCLLFRQEKLTGKKMIGTVLGFLGVVIVNVAGTSVDLGVSFLGEGLIVLSALSSAFYSAFIKKFSKNSDVVMLSGYQFFFGGVVMTVIGLLLGGKLRPEGFAGILLLIYMGFISAAAYTLWSILLKYNNVSRISAYKFMNPVFGVLLSFLFLHENSHMEVQIIIALALVCAGIYIVNAGDLKYNKSIK